MAPKKKGKEGAARKAEDENKKEWHSRVWYTTVFLIFVLLSIANTVHVSTLFENDRHFSHLADFEREMTYRTEMGLYYSYYKSVITAPSFTDGLKELVDDNVTEYGHTINTLKRFNLYPELILGGLYRHFRFVVDKVGWKTEICWRVNRGQGLSAVESCEGIGNPHYFYVNAVFTLTGLVPALIFLMGVILSDSILGGVLAAASFFFNHGEATRVQWTPPLRESWSYPFILLQGTLVTWILSRGSYGVRYALYLLLPSLASLLSWQFTQFVFSTQLCALTLVLALDGVNLSTYSTIIFSHLMSLFISFVLLFGNEMLLASVYLPSILASLIALLTYRLFSFVSIRPIFVILILGVFSISVVLLKISIAGLLSVEDDAHIFEILRSKFTDFASFHTRLYTCSAEFGFIQQEAIDKLTRTLLLPLSLGAFLLVVVSFLRSQPVFTRNSSLFPYSHVVFHVFQSIAFIIMAVLIMRLKLFMTPYLCISTSLLFSSQLILSALNVRLSNILRLSIFIALFASTSYQGFGNLKHQWSIQGEYSNIDQELLFDWIKTNTKKEDVFAGTMPVMANVKLSTERPIVNHPHYEDKGIRERTLTVYSIFSKRPIQEVHSALKKMGVKYIIIQPFNCDPHPRKECSYRSMWDLHDSSLQSRPSLCDIWLSSFKLPPAKANPKIQPFTLAYSKANYIVLKV